MRSESTSLNHAQLHHGIWWCYRVCSDFTKMEVEHVPLKDDLLDSSGETPTCMCSQESSPWKKPLKKSSLISSGRIWKYKESPQPLDRLV